MKILVRRAMPDGETYIHMEIKEFIPTITFVVDGVNGVTEKCHYEYGDKGIPFYDSERYGGTPSMKNKEHYKI